MVGGQRCHGRMFVLIEDKDGVQYAFPMFTLPLGYVQFERIVDFYSNYPDARLHLGHRSGLVHVRSLMDFPVLEIVADLHAHGKSGGESRGAGKSGKSDKSGKLVVERAICGSFV